MNSPRLETLADTQYAAKASQYVEILNNLRRLGAHHTVDLPTVVFCGNQSAGKSSLLEAISGVKLPRSGGTCTRCVMEIRLMKSPPDAKWECQVSLRQEYDDFTNQQLPRANEFKFGDLISDPEAVEITARRAQKALLNPSSRIQKYINCDLSYDMESDNEYDEIKFTKNVVCLEIKGPKVPNLSMIDLPGIIRHVENPEDEKFISLIEDLVKYYVTKEKSIIIATITCKDEIDNQAIVGMAKKVDPDGIRTLGVLTKPDTIEEGTHESWLRIMRGEAHQLLLGYYVVKNPNKADLNNGITFEQSRKKELKFFETNSPWKDFHLQNRIGVENLRVKLSELLIKAIQRGLPTIKKELEEQLEETRIQLEKMPEPISGNYRVELFRMVKKFSTVIREETSTTNERIELWQDINAELKRFKTELCSKRPIFVVGKTEEGTPARFDILEEFLDKDEDLVSFIVLANPEEVAIDANESRVCDDQIYSQEVTEAEVQERIRVSRGRLLPGLVPYSAANVLIRDFQKKWKPPSQKCLSNIYDLMETLVNEVCTATFGRFPSLVGAMRQYAQLWLDECKLATNKKIDFINSMENKYPFTLDNATMSEGKVKYLAELQEAVRLDERDSSEHLEVIAVVMAYFRLSFKRYADIVSMTIIHAFVDEYSALLEEKLLSPFLEIENDDESAIAELVREDDSVARDRNELLQKEKYMREVLSDLMRFGF